MIANTFLCLTGVKEVMYQTCKMQNADLSIILFICLPQYWATSVFVASSLCLSFCLAYYIRIFPFLNLSVCQAIASALPHTNTYFTHFYFCEDSRCPDEF